MSPIRFRYTKVGGSKSSKLCTGRSLRKMGGWEQEGEEGVEIGETRAEGREQRVEEGRDRGGDRGKDRRREIGGERR